ncbi:MAG TPA: ABC transporter ATP-binding protein [Candidatus Acidoferrales bacterium]|nr:ABC transporter ATP-binding protein [Candidatus Acidoferrales bacterium]
MIDAPLQSKPKLEVRDVHVHYTNKRTGAQTIALDKTSFSVRSGEFVCIVGPSGCGKTTLLNCLDGLRPISGGEMLVDGRPVSGPGPDRAMVFQSPSLMPWRSVLRNVTYGLEAQGVPAGEAGERAKKMIDLVGLSGFEHYSPGELSGGMQQRVNLARALVIEPELILLDEPFAALDAQTRELMQAELLRVWRVTKKTAVFITHQISEAVFLADRVIVLSSRPGRVKAIVDIDLPRPRSLDIKHDPRTVELERKVEALIDSAVTAEQLFAAAGD